ncbi:hypothetical protein [Cuneatibacter caecimuris]|uniref:Uncharacterized protein n=1 Tax=Cuneatibacter caecimuris TaxID=1796618 RepID=A0A4Q7P2J9_9FIRM|nr:hypothetical protein [Cuneatibacter caecimuris]RZS92882.1 hypothetical protein EV209_2625 [Cuneatibacter caecimuris]
MRRLCGLVLFCIGFGMAVMLFLPIGFWSICIMLCLLMIGYNLFCQS